MYGINLKEGRKKGIEKPGEINRKHSKVVYLNPTILIIKKWYIYE